MGGRLSRQWEQPVRSLKATTHPAGSREKGESQRDHEARAPRPSRAHSELRRSPQLVLTDSLGNRKGQSRDYRYWRKPSQGKQTKTNTKAGRPENSCRL